MIPFLSFPSFFQESRAVVRKLRNAAAALPQTPVADFRGPLLGREKGREGKREQEGREKGKKGLGKWKEGGKGREEEREGKGKEEGKGVCVIGVIGGIDAPACSQLVATMTDSQKWQDWRPKHLCCQCRSLLQSLGDILSGSAWSQSQMPDFHIQKKSQTASPTSGQNFLETQRPSWGRLFTPKRNGVDVQILYSDATERLLQRVDVHTYSDAKFC